MVVPPETFAGKDLMQIEMENFETLTQQRKQSNAKFFPTPAPVAAPVIEAAAPAGEEAVDEPTSGNYVVGNINAASEAASTAQTTEVIAAVIATPQTTDREASDDSPELVSEGALTVSQTQPSLNNTQNEHDLPVGSVHVGAMCDVCGAKPIIGVRWRCLMCDDYDLCDRCRSSGAYNQGHLVEHRMLRKETCNGASTQLGERRIPDGVGRYHSVAPGYFLQRMQKLPNSWYPLEVYGLQGLRSLRRLS